MHNFINKNKTSKSKYNHISNKLSKYSTKTSICLSNAFNVKSHWKEHKFLTPHQKSTQMFNMSKDWTLSMSLKTTDQKRNIGKWLSYLDKEVDYLLPLSKTIDIDFSDVQLNVISYEELNPKKSPMEVLYLLSEFFEYQNIPYAIGGAFALSHYTVPKNTGDIDINIWIDTKKELKSIISILHSKSPIKILSENEKYEQNIMRFFWHDIKIKMYFPTYSLIKNQVRNTIQSGLPHPKTLKEVLIISKESLSIFKLWWYRDKDIDDLKMLLFMNNDIDNTFVLQGINSLVESRIIKSQSNGIEKINIWNKLYNDYYSFSKNIN